LTAAEHLRWTTDCALDFFDKGDKKNALASFLSNIGKHEGTRWIQTHPATLMIIHTGLSQGREGFEQAMLGFAV